jgi:cytosine/adenosine deaminase-related metal-dependent hydrolase
MTMIIHAGIALVDADFPPRSDFAVCVDGNRIAATGSLAELRARYPDAEQIGGKNLVMVPAFVDSHDHGRGLGTTKLGIPDDMLEVWILGLWSQPTIDPYLTAAYDALLLLRSGVGTVAHSANPRNWILQGEESEAGIRAYQEAGIRVAYQPIQIDQNTLVYDGEAEFLASLPSEARDMALPFTRPPGVELKDYLQMCEDLWQRYQDVNEHMVHVQISPSGGQWCSDELIVEAADFAQRRNTRVHMHMLETRYQQHYASRRWGKSFIRHMDEIGALGPWLTLAHMIWVEPEDMALLAERGVGIAHQPGSNLRVRSGVANVPAMLQAGIPVGIGLDGYTLDDDQDYLREMRLAWTLANRPGYGSPVISSPSIWRMGTAGGAAITLGADVQLGKLAPGYLADLVLLDYPFWLEDLDTGDGEEWCNPLEILLRGATHQHVRQVMVNGRWVVRDGKSTTLDEAEIVAGIKENLARQNGEDRRKALIAARTLAPHLRRFYASWDR